MGHSTLLKKIVCDTCGSFEMSEATRLDDGARSLLMPTAWRLIWREQKISFRCAKCWRELSTGAFPLTGSDSDPAIEVS